MNRRHFSLLLPAFAASCAAAETQAKPAKAGPPIQSGVYPPSAPYQAGPGRISQRFLTGMLSASLRLEAHETVIEPGAPPEDTRKHLHNEIWLMKEGSVELWAEGTSHTMQPGDLGLVAAGTMHYVKNIGTTRASYFVLAVGPPE